MPIKTTFEMRSPMSFCAVWISEIISLGKRSREKPLLPVAQKRAAHFAAHLCGNANGVAVFIFHEDGFNHLPVVQAEKILFGAVYFWKHAEWRSPYFVFQSFLLKQRAGLWKGPSSRQTRSRRADAASGIPALRGIFASRARPKSSCSSESSMDFISVNASSPSLFLFFCAWRRRKSRPRRGPWASWCA